MRFEQLNTGDIFVCNNMLLIKIAPARLYKSDMFYERNEFDNAVCLSSGMGKMYNVGELVRVEEYDQVGKVVY